MLKQSIIFNGFMGVGKTTIAKQVAEELNYTFVDIDKEIIKSFNLPITEIFKQFGEKSFRKKKKGINNFFKKKTSKCNGLICGIFRKKETELISFFTKQPVNVIALGGGAFKNPENINTCLKNGLVIHLDPSYEHWKIRMPKLIDTRPILQNKTGIEIKELYDERQL